MRYTELLRRSFELVKRNPILWLFGSILVILGAGGSNTLSYRTRSTDIRPQFGQELPANPAIQLNPEGIIPLLIGAAVIVCAVAVALSLVRALFDGGLIGLVDDADYGRQLSFRQGWQHGTAAMWRVWLIDIVLILPLVVIAACVIGVSILALPNALAVGQGYVPAWIAFVIVSEAIMALILLIVLALLIGPFARIAKRICVLEHTSWSESIRAAWTFVRQHTLATILTWAIFGTLNALAELVLAFPVAAIAAAIVGALMYGSNGLSTVVFGLAGLFVLYLVFVLVAAGALLAFYWTGWTLFVKWSLHPPVIAEAAVTSSFAPADGPAGI